MRATAVDLLTGLGYHVLQASDGESALAILESGMEIDLLFTDVVMPGPVRSVEMARQAKLLLPSIEVLFTSGYTQNAIVHGGRLDPGVELLSKPYRREDLARKIRTLLNRRLSPALSPSTSPPMTLPPADAAPAAPMAILHTEKSTENAFEAVEAFETVEAVPSVEASALRILVVDDVEDARSILVDLLEIMGHAAVSAADAPAALLLLESQTFDALLTDVKLPGMSGIELARLARQSSPRMTVIFSSGYGAVPLEEAGFSALSLPKPYEMDDLHQVLVQVEPLSRA